MAMAMSDSVTVSMGLETMGVFKEIFLVKPGLLTAGGTGGVPGYFSGNWCNWFSMDLKPRIDGNTGSLAAKMVDDLIDMSEMGTIVQ